MTTRRSKAIRLNGNYAPLPYASEFRSGRDQKSALWEAPWSVYPIEFTKLRPLAYRSHTDRAQTSHGVWLQRYELTINQIRYEAII